MPAMKTGFIDSLFELEYCFHFSLVKHIEVLMKNVIANTTLQDVVSGIELEQVPHPLFGIMNGRIIFSISTPECKKALEIAKLILAWSLTTGAMVTGVILWSNNDVKSGNENLLITGKILTGLSGLLFLKVTHMMLTKNK